MNFKKWVKSIQTAGYNGAHTVNRRSESAWRPKQPCLGIYSWLATSTHSQRTFFVEIYWTWNKWNKCNLAVKILDISKVKKMLLQIQFQPIVLCLMEPNIIVMCWWMLGGEIRQGPIKVKVIDLCKKCAKPKPNWDLLQLYIPHTVNVYRELQWCLW